MGKKINLGFYMFTPMIGGAEKLLQDLLFGINREQFKVSLFYESWPEFDAFLNLSHCLDVHIYPVPILEPGGHILSMLAPRAASPQDTPTGLHNMGVRAIAFLKQIHTKYNPIRKQTGYLLNTLANYLCAGPNIFHLYLALKKQDLDILHIINGGYPGSMSAREAALAAKLAGIPVCIMTVCASPAKRKFPQFIEKKIDDLVYKCVDKFIVPAKSVGRLLTDLRGLEPSKLCTIPWGVSLAPPLTNFAISKLKSELKIPEGVKIIGNIARFELRKGHRYLIEAISVLKKKIDGFHVVLVGEGPVKREIENQVEALGLKEIITFTGYRPDTCEITQMFDIFVYPSILEGLPISLLEAMSLGKPIVATPADGISEAIIDGKTGLIVPPQDSSALAQSIERFLINPELAKAMGKAAFAKYEMSYTLKDMIERNEILYQELFFKNRQF